MNDLDEMTFAEFARRFARIEQLVPDLSRPHRAAVARPRSGVGELARPAVLMGAVVLLAAALAAAAVGSWIAPKPTIPPDSAPATLVLDAYLGALVAGDCTRADRLVDPLLIGSWNTAALCGGLTHVTAFSVTGSPAFVGPNRIALTTILTTTGSATGLPAGDFRFGFTLLQQSSGAWRVVEVVPGTPLTHAT